VSPVIGGRHLGFGTRNALVRLGECTYLEIVGIDPDQAMPADSRLFGLEVADVDDDQRTPRAASTEGDTRKVPTTTPSRRRSIVFTTGAGRLIAFVNRPRARRAGGLIVLGFDAGP
jgi:hypothetical protein